jgi:cytochrome c biogenesis protein CcmG, thiol:disulfide interchange protein DsbE
VRRLIFALPLALLAALAAVFFLGFGHDPRAVPSALIDRPAPEFALPPLPGRDRGLASGDLKGRVRVVNVFASWCLPCRAEHPLLTGLARRVPVMGINYKDKPGDAAAWLAKLGDPYAAIGADTEGRVAIDWGVYGVPETFLVDAEGRIRFKHVGPLTPEVIDGILNPLIEKAGRS